MSAEQAAENGAPRYHSHACMEAWMHPCRCGIEQVTPAATSGDA